MKFKISHFEESTVGKPPDFLEEIEKNILLEKPQESVAYIIEKS